MGRNINSPSHLRVVVDNDRPPPPDAEDTALEALREAQARWLKTGRKEDAQAAERAYRNVIAAAGGDPDAAMPLHGWRYK